MFVQPGNVKLTGEAGALEHAALQGNGVKDWNYYTSLTKAHDENEKKSITARIRIKMIKNEALTEEEKEVVRIAQLRSREAVSKTIKAHPDSPLSGFLLYNYLKSQRDYKTGKELYDGLSEKGKNAHYAKLFKAISDKQGQLEQSAGAPAPAFTLTDKDGKQVSLSDYKGKYVLLDFWGSWCAPCRRSHPHLVELYTKYKDKNLDILGLASEKESDNVKWFNAIERDGLPWRQVNLKTNETGKEVKTNYHVTAFPTKILIGPDGEIVFFSVGATNEIEEKLKIVFSD